MAPQYNLTGRGSTFSGSTQSQTRSSHRSRQSSSTRAAFSLCAAAWELVFKSLICRAHFISINSNKIGKEHQAAQVWPAKTLGSLLPEPPAHLNLKFRLTMKAWRLNGLALSHFKVFFYPLVSYSREPRNVFSATPAPPANHFAVLLR